METDDYSYRDQRENRNHGPGQAPVNPQPGESSDSTPKSPRPQNTNAFLPDGQVYHGMVHSRLSSTNPRGSQTMEEWLKGWQENWDKACGNPRVEEWSGKPASKRDIVSTVLTLLQTSLSFETD